MNENDLAQVIVECAIETHKQLGPGLFESVYEKVLSYKLTQQNLKIKTQVSIPIIVDQITIDNAFKIDIIVNDLVILEIKSVKSLDSVHSKQLLTYLRLSNKKLGFLINFNTELLRNGIKRIINGYIK